MSEELYRHGDILVQKVESIPRSFLPPLRGLILAQGEVTGHAHRIDPQGASVTLYRSESGIDFVVEGGPVLLVHDEHDTIELQPGNYRSWHQREYLPGTRPGEVRFRPVSD